MHQMNNAGFRDDQVARAFCEDFLAGTRPRYVFGRNEYAASIVSALRVDGLIDDFTNETSFLGSPIVPAGDVPKDALVVSVVIGRPFVAAARLDTLGLRYLDYFSFQRFAGIRLLPVRFWDEFRADFEANKTRYIWLEEHLQDDQSRATLDKIINFRLSGDLGYMRGFSDCQYRQYFEDFLALKPAGEIFVDVGGFDGNTSLEFARRCPAYTAIHVFEPEPKNMAVIADRLAALPNVTLHPFGCSNRAQSLRFRVDGSTSRVSENGDIEIEVVRLDDTLVDRFSYLKMDIEGGEMAAIEGARQSILDFHPRLAISVYHRFDDFWRIPEAVLSCRSDYQVYMRHYTEGVDETVMFFIPDGLH